MSAQKLFHNVYFWLNPELSDQEIEAFKGFFDDLRGIPEARELYVGVPADTEVRDVVENSFTYSLTVVFDSREEHDRYQEHELHFKAIEKYSHYWNRVLVHDSTTIDG